MKSKRISVEFAKYNRSSESGCVTQAYISMQNVFHFCRYEFRCNVRNLVIFHMNNITFHLIMSGFFLVQLKILKFLNKNNFVFFSLFAVPLTYDTFNKWRTDFYQCEKNVLAQNVCSRIDPFEAALSRKVLETTQHVFTYKVESEGKPLTNQKNSGRCWLFAALNAIRIPFMKNVSKN